MAGDRREMLFKEWLNEHKGLVFRVVRAYCGGRGDDQEDLFQEILLQLWISIPRFNGEAKESTWIYRVALNTALVWKRKEKKRRRDRKKLFEFSNPTDSSDTADQAISQQQVIDQVYGAISRLPKVDRSLMLLYLDGVSYRQMAEIIGISESNVGVKLNRCKKQLAQLLKGLIDDV